MENKNQSLVDYLTEQMSAGHSEATLREHLRAHGWGQEAIDAAFAAHHRPATHTERTKPKKKGLSVRGRPKRPSKWPKPKPLVWMSVGAVMVVAGVVFWQHRPMLQPKAPPAPHLTHQQQQTIDVNTLGGAVGQYVATSNRTLPKRIAPAPDGSSIVLCGATCDPTTWQVSALQQYSPSEVKLVAFTPGVAVPDAQFLYLVSGAKCNNAGIPDTQHVSALSMVILYATDEPGSLKQHCVTL